MNKTLLRSVREYKKQSILAPLLVILEVLMEVLIPLEMAKIIDVDFSRIQFTPDLMPSDILGTEILEIDENNKKYFKFIKGPIFSNIVLADEINRTPPKTQAALLEAMQERSVTIAGASHKLDAPFFVLATQNPIEQEGTYPLPEAQLDRFMFNLTVDYPTEAEEIQIVKNTTMDSNVQVNPVLTGADIVEYQNLVRKVPVADNVIQYAVKLVQRTRIQNATPEIKALINWGAGPRASQSLIIGAKAHALFRGKYSPDIEDVIAIAAPILRHRIVPSFNADAEGITSDMIIQKLIKS